MALVLAFSIIFSGVIVPMFYHFVIELVEKINPIEWSYIPQREVIKQSLRIHIIENNFGICDAKAPGINGILYNTGFKKGTELALFLNHDAQKGTIKTLCDKKAGQNGYLNIWYVTPESPVHQAKYKYFLSENPQ